MRSITCSASRAEAPTRMSNLRTVLACLLIVSFAFERYFEISVWRPWRVLTVVCLAACLVNNRWRFSRIEWALWAAMALGVCMGVLMLGSGYGNKQDLVQMAGVSAFSMAAGLAVRQSVRTLKQLQWLILAFGMAMLISAGFIYAGFGWVDDARSSGYMKNPNNTATLGLVTVLLLAGYAVSARKVWQRVIAALAAAIVLSVVPATGSRTAIFAFVAACMSLAWLYRKSRAWWATLVLVFVALIFGFWSGAIGELWKDNVIMERLKTKGFSDIRPDLWQAGLRAYADQGYLGVGMGQFRALSIKGVKIPEMRAGGLGLHSDVVAMLVENGPFALVLFLGAYVALFRQLSLRANHASPRLRHLGRFILAAMVVSAISSCTGVSVIGPHFWCYVAVALAYLDISSLAEPVTLAWGRPRFARSSAPAVGEPSPPSSGFVSSSQHFSCS